MTSIPSFASRFSLLCCLHSLGYCQDLLIRTDRGRNVSVEWPVAPSVVGDYTYVSILHNGHVTMFCSDPFLVACQVNLRQMALLRVTDSSRLVVRLGFGVVNVELQDAGSYRMEVVKSGDNSELRNVVFYVFRRPTRPIILGKFILFLFCILLLSELFRVRNVFSNDNYFTTSSSLRLLVVNL